MKQIHSSSNTSEIASVASGIVELNKTNTIAEDGFFTITYTKLQGKSNELIQKINTGWYSLALEEKDELRDQDIRAIFYEVEAKCNRRPDSEQENALRIKTVLDRYGLKITRDSYSKESTNIKAMLSDLKSDELSDNIVSIPDLNILISNLDNSQASFDQTVAQQIKDKVERDNSKPASEIAQELKHIINNEFCPYTGAMSQANPAKFKKYADLLSKIIEDNNNQVRNRLATLKRKKEEETATEA